MQPKTGNNCSQYLISDSGAAAWLTANEAGTLLDAITIRDLAHLVIKGSVCTVSLFSQETSFLHIQPEGNLAIDEELDIVTFVSFGGTLNLTGRNVTFSRSVSVWGNLTTQPETSLSFGGERMVLVPDDSASDNQFLSLRGLTIHENSVVSLEGMSDAQHCGYILDVHGDDEGQLEMKTGSSLIVACSVSIVTNTVTLQHAEFSSCGRNSQTSLIRTNQLNILSDVSTGPLKLEEVNELNVGVSGNLTFDPFYNNFTVATIYSAGFVLSTLPLSVVSQQFDIVSGSFIWCGSDNSSFDSHSVYVNGIFLPGDAVAIYAGFQDFEVDTQGEVELVVTTEFKVDSFQVNGEVRINSDVSFAGKSNDSIDTFLVGTEGTLTLLEAANWTLTEIRAKTVTLNGYFDAGLLSIANGFELLQVRGHFEFDPVGDFELGEVVISGWFESHSPLVFGNILNRTSTYRFEVTAGSTVKLNSQYRGGNITPSVMYSETVVIDGTFDAGVLEVHVHFLTVSGSMVFDPANVFESQTLLISGHFEAQSPIRLVGGDQATLETAPNSGVVFNSLGNSNGSHGMPYSQLMLSSLKVSGAFIADKVQLASPMRLIEVTSSGELQATSVGQSLISSI